MIVGREGLGEKIILWKWSESRKTLPRPPTRMHEGATCVFPFSWESGAFLAVFSGRANLEKGVFLVTANGNQYPR